MYSLLFVRQLICDYAIDRESSHWYCCMLQKIYRITIPVLYGAML